MSKSYRFMKVYKIRPCDTGKCNSQPVCGPLWSSDLWCEDLRERKPIILILYGWQEKYSNDYDIINIIIQWLNSHTSTSPLHSLSSALHISSTSPAKPQMCKQDLMRTWLTAEILYMWDVNHTFIFWKLSTKVPSAENSNTFRSNERLSTFNFKYIFPITFFT